MKKSEMRSEAKNVLLRKFMDVLGAKNMSYTSTYLDTLWRECSELEGMLWAYRWVGLISDAQFHSLYSIKINIVAYQDIFNPLNKGVFNI